MKKTALQLLFALVFASFSAQGQVIFTEIMYNPPESGTDSLEYLELYNTTNSSINLENWTLGGVTHTFAAGTSIAANGYLVIGVKSSAIQNTFGVTAIQWGTGGLSNSGEKVSLLDASGAIIDEVDFKTDGQWPTEANGQGYSLELCDVTADNSLAANWKKSGTATGVFVSSIQVFASPGQVNGAACIPDADFTVSVQDFSFSPKDITISQGQSVVWVNLGGNHNVNGSLATFPTNPEGFSSGMPSSANWNFLHVFEIPGTYQYRCDPHAALGMVGTVTVLPYAPADVVITEIMYNDPSAADSLEYIELHNRGTSEADLGGWKFTLGISHEFPAGTLIPAGGYLVLARNASAFNNVFKRNALQWTTGVLNNTGELLELRDGLNNNINSFTFSSQSPWPAAANGTGKSMVLCDPASDNSVGSNWRAATTPTGAYIDTLEIFANPYAASGCSNALVANNDVVNSVQNSTSFLNVLSNDELPGAITSLTVVTAAMHGTTVVVGNQIYYTSNIDYCGTDMFQYQVCVGANCATATVNITVSCYDQLTMEQAKELDANGVAVRLGQAVELTGIVHGVNLRPTGLQFWLIEANNEGIGVFLNAGNLGYTVKERDAIKIYGKITQFSGLTQIEPVIIEKIGNDSPLVNPRLLSGALTENDESSLLELRGLRLVNPAQWTTGTGASGFTCQAVFVSGGTDTITIRIDNDVTLYNAPAPDRAFDLIGIGSQFDPASPYNSGYQILPRYDDDLILLVNTKESISDLGVTFGPNPTQGIFWVQSETGLDRISVYNILGNVVTQVQNSGTRAQLDLSNQAAGVYYLQVEKDGQRRAASLILRGN